MHALYKGEIAYARRKLRQLLAKLEELGLYDDTVIALVGDHGEEFLDHGGFWHGLTLYEEQIHVPLLVKWRKGAAAAPPVVDGVPARLIDVAPTLLARAGARVPRGDAGARPGRRPAPSGTRRSARSSPRRTTKATCCARSAPSAGSGSRPTRATRAACPSGSCSRSRWIPSEKQNVVEREPGTAAELHQHAEGQQLAAESARVGEAKSAAISPRSARSLCALGYLTGPECTNPTAGAE